MDKKTWITVFAIYAGMMLAGVIGASIAGMFATLRPDSLYLEELALLAGPMALGVWIGGAGLIGVHVCIGYEGKSLIRCLSLTRRYRHKDTPA